MTPTVHRQCRYLTGDHCWDVLESPDAQGDSSDTSLKLAFCSSFSSRLESLNYREHADFL